MSQTQDEPRGAGLAGPTDQRPLTEQEFQQVQRYFGDPFSFPISYKTWLVSYLESSDLSLPISAINGLTSILGIAGVGGGTIGILPAGIILPFGADIAPVGSLLCDGASYSRTAQARLFTAIGTRYGAVDGASFSVPDIRERIPVGKGTMAANDTLGKNEGMPLGQRGAAHHHTLPMNQDGSTSGGYTVVGTDHAADGSQSIGPGGTPADTPAFITLNFVIIS